MGDLAATERANVVSADGGPRLEDDPGTELLTKSLVGESHHLDIADRRMPIKEFLDLPWRDVLASPNHDVLAAPDDAAIALFIELGEVARVHPASCIQHFARFSVFAPIPEHDGIAAGAQLPGLPERHDMVRVVHDLDFEMRHDAADGGHPHVHGVANSRLETHRTGFGHAI